MLRLKDKMKRYIIVLLFVTGSAANILAQPRFNHEQGNVKYRDYELLLNPATTGSKDCNRISLSLDKQWLKIDNSPLSEILQYQMPVAQNNGIGAWFYNETYGVRNIIQIAAAYAYKIRMENTTLSLGLNASLLWWRENRVTDINNPNDPAFADAPDNQTGFNTGLGVYYSGDKFYAGFSIPQMLTNDFNNDDKRGELENKIDFARMHYYFTGGCTFDLGSKFNLQPTALVALSGDTPAGFECMLTGKYDTRFEFGAGMANHYRLQITAGAVVAENISLRYQYAQNLGSDYRYTGTSHFIVLRFQWREKKTPGGQP